MSPNEAYAAKDHLLDGSRLSIWWGLPFVGVLLSLALMPLLVPHFWHHHFGKVSFMWSLCVITPLIYFFGADIATHEILVTMLKHYFPFILLAGSLYIIAGGIRLSVRSEGLPPSNTVLMAVATVVASVIGTTGAAMLFIRPLLSALQSRQHRTHTIIFFILLVGNIGGCLTALGDPPLFLGFLFGVNFFWPTLNMIEPFLIVTLPLLCIYFLIDTYYYRREPLGNVAEKSQRQKKLVIVKGKGHILLLLGVIGSVLMSGVWKPDITLAVSSVKLELQDLVRDFLLLFLSIVSMLFMNQGPRTENRFSWDPLKEVVKLFAGIFITAAPVVIMLGAGKDGVFAPIMTLVNGGEISMNAAYFWLTGGLSAFLDNAPTYMIFFHMAGGDPEILMTTLSRTLLAISAGSVFMGALTYIGNAPNFMIKAIAESNNIPMPSFFGYMVWSFCLLIPLFMILTYFYF